MTTDDERRAVARRLREIADGYEEVSDFDLASTLSLEAVSRYGYDPDDVRRLADLIEPNRGSGGRIILCAHCESASWCGCEPGDEEGGCDFEPSVTEGEPPYNLYSLYEAVLKRHPRDECAIDDDEVDELVDALLDICNAPGHERIQRFQPPYPDATASYKGWRAEVYDPDGVLVSPSNLAADLVRAHADGKVPSEPEVRRVAEVKVDGERIEKLAHDAVVELTGIDRDALLALADEMDTHWLGHEGMEDSPVARWARELREVLGGDGRDHTADVSVSSYDLQPREDREAIEWVREHGGVDELTRMFQDADSHRDVLLALADRMEHMAGMGALLTAHGLAMAAASIREALGVSDDA